MRWQRRLFGDCDGAGLVTVAADGDVLARAQVLLQCPLHQQPLERLPGRLSCGVCAFEVKWTDGILTSGASGLPAENLAQRAMASSFVSTIYEAAWRPLLMRLVTGFGTDAEDAMTTRHAGSRTAPTVLELCCGPARAARAHAGRDGTALGIDLSYSMLRQARRHSDPARLFLLHGDAEQPLARRGAFDLALCFAALHLLAEPERAVAAASQALRPGGAFVAWTLIPARILNPRLAPPERLARLGLRPMQPGQLQALFQRSGLEVVESVIDGAIEAVAGRRL